MGRRGGELSIIGHPATREETPRLVGSLGLPLVSSVEDTRRRLAERGIAPLEPVADPDGAARRNRPWVPSPFIDRVDARSPTGARVVARHQALAHLGPHAEALRATAALAREAATPCLRGLRHGRDDFRALRLALRGVVAPGPNVVAGASWDRARPVSAPRVDGAALRVDASRLVDDGPGMAGVVALRATGASLERGRASLAWFPLPVAWRQHAAERAHERAAVAGDVHAALGAELARLAPAIAAMSAAAAAVDPDLQVAVPFLGGLLMGSTNVGQAGVRGSSIAHSAVADAARVGGRRRGAYGSHDALGTWWACCGVGGGATWTAITYVGPSDMGPARRAYAEAFAALTARHRVEGTLDLVARATGMEEDRGAVPALGPDEREALPALAREAAARGVAGLRPQAREAMAAVPVRRRDVDDDPALRGFRGAGMPDVWG